jgi:hypothetical protein
MKIDDPVYEIREKESFKHACEITQPFGGLDSVISWCKENMRDVWRWQLVQVSSDIRPGRYIFYFDSDRDYCAFLLKYKD